MRSASITLIRSCGSQLPIKISSQVAVRARSGSRKPPGNHRCGDRAADTSPPFAVDPEFVDAFAVATNLDYAVAILGLGVLIPDDMRFDDMSVGIDDSNHDGASLD
jgi:hypothetical protein